VEFGGVKWVGCVCFVVMATETEVQNLDVIVDQLLESMELAMEGEGVDAETRERVLDTVGDAAGNHSAELLPYVSDSVVR